MSHARQAPQREPALTLTLLAGGGAEVTRDGVQVWASDTDDEFADEFGEEFLDENDFDGVLTYLEDQGIVSKDQADNMECVVESMELVGPGDDEDDDEDDDFEPED